MNLKIKCSRLFYVVVCLISCSEKEFSEQDIFLTVSERKKFHIGEGGLTPEPFYFVSFDSTRTSGVIYNKIAHSLDSVFLSADSAWVKDGDLLDTEGPYGVGSVASFFTTPENNVFMNPQEFFKQEIETKEVSQKFMNDYGIFEEEGFAAIFVPVYFSVSHEFNGLDRNSDVGYFVYDNDKQVRVLGYDPQVDSMYFTTIPLDSEKYFSLRFKVKYEGLTLGGNDAPQISVVGSNMIISYPAFSDFLVYDLRSKEQKTFTSMSNFFPSERKLPENYSEEVDSGELQWELNETWRSEVSYGPMTYLEDWDKYIRLVKGEGSKDASYFIEVFNKDFQKIEEFNLTEINPDLSPNYLNTKYGLMFRAKDQPDEDLMYYYNVNLTDMK